MVVVALHGRGPEDAQRDDVAAAAMSAERDAVVEFGDDSETTPGPHRQRIKR